MDKNLLDRISIEKAEINRLNLCLSSTMKERERYLRQGLYREWESKSELNLKALYKEIRHQEGKLIRLNQIKWHMEEVDKFIYSVSHIGYDETFEAISSLHGLFGFWRGVSNADNPFKNGLTM